MKNKKAVKKNASKPNTQTYLDITEVRDGVVVLRDGTIRAVLITSSVNFALKSEDEQNSTISAYVGFLNSLDFPVQICVQSRRLQIKPYLEKLIAREKVQSNELLRVQTADYRSFIEELVDIGKIMTKKYYVIVPFDPLSNKKKSFWARFKEVLKPALSLHLKDERFRQRKEDLDLRVRQVSAGLEGIGLQVAQLDTQSLIELYYNTYNPDISFAEQLGDIDKLQIEEV
ncbi:MAG: hypothetical protein COY69_01310 [Candidatus Magasanikbacteria bacterium CG_4_10_14_0_8_um_filter_32_14]|uniref:TraC-like domain-containing protein n=1 Tax=Candidatus Magasanikbacteria bacterium CG_4_10_14_0_8_um_filter_32_14 TaxID=1974640 RepID=A0A2M7R9R7_9BACT|nr:MAG: hypothetical protein COY69_01310 [Candidatus Magasanikbacteria bacterium CG_4_10_14_0_8_um_filter_32_14]